MATDDDESIEALFERKKVQMQSLAKRLGINDPHGKQRNELITWMLENVGDLTTWAKIGYLLAQEQPEFTRKRRGRKKLELGLDMDISRAQLIESIKSNFRRHGWPEMSNAEAIRLASRLKVFSHVSQRRLENSVAKGNRKIAALKNQKSTL